MTPEEYYRVKELGYRGKRGFRFSPEESEFIDQMFTKSPEEYRQAHMEGVLEAIREINPLME